MRRDKTWGWTDELVKADDLTRESGGFDGPEVAKSLRAPRLARGFAISAAGAERWFDIGKFVGEDSGAGK